MKKSSILINGPAGELEIRVKPSRDPGSSKLVVISHPHPLYGGTMNNKVVTTLERGFSATGYHTVAYNFRGVGKSQGSYDNGGGEQADLLAVLEWAKTEFEPEYIVLGGFSFGSYVTLKGLPQYGDIDALCTVAPPVGLYDFSVIDDIEPSWSLIQGGEDEVVCAKEILDWAMSRSIIPDIYWRAKASHFFHGELVWLRKLIESNF